MRVRVDGVSKRYVGLAALDNVSLEVQPGELVALLGPSGSGKTTLLRTIAGLEFPDTGAVYFNDEDAAKSRIQDRGVGLVFQHYALFKHMRVKDNIAFGLRARPGKSRPSGDAIRKRVEELLDLVQLSGLGDRFPAQLSGGQRQRVALARALAIEPKVLLLDEPFGALDARVRKDLRRWLREIHDRTGHTTLFVTHDQEEALELADRVVVMNAGRIEQIATPDEIYDSPASPFVFSFIGESSVLPVVVSGGRVLLDGVPLDIAAGALADGPARLFVRPEDVAISPEGGLEARITATRRTGGNRRISALCGAGEHTVEFDIAAEEPAQAGQTMMIRVIGGLVFDDGNGGFTSEKLAGT
jgi:sulfate transport system ATP-binding protein